MSWVRTLVLRLATGVLVLWAAATTTFLGLATTEGDTALAILGGPSALPTPEVLEQVRREYGLDRPIAVQYLHYLGRLLQGDLGESYRLQVPVARAIGQQLGASLQLAAAAGSVAIGLAVTVALLTAGRGRRATALVSGGELVLSSMPSFVLGILLLLQFSFHWPLFPPAGADGWRSLVLPSLTLALPLSAVLAQVLRQELESVLEQPFIAMARARGLSEAGVRLGRALRHTAPPLLTLSGFIFAGLIGGTVVTETLFARQGVGRLMTEAATSKDIPLVMGITLLAAATYVLVHLVVDLLNAVADPRVRSR